MKISAIVLAGMGAVTLSGCSAPAENAEAPANGSGNAVADVATAANALDTAAEQAATPEETAVLENQVSALNATAERLPDNADAPAQEHVIDGRKYELVDQ